ncbi:hypothetical protein F5B22DRAFT_634118 [Xylaria bambusicola]|uniref:uncharacterized protein n=1 Tax=Xylaria bambusicola TaxID=326684 RepID=UPI0020088591|nr:uncharacterized protein F5B22DRAFT_634118 [Xylaria bambusicola]KAI0522215.1 hypothetical protein F5B22DRAFT_634118 [Xylaria bambusicola]
MALDLVAAHAASNLDMGTNIFVARDLFSSANVNTLEARQDSGNDTVTIFIDSPEPEKYEYAASVVYACPVETVYALRCTAGGPDSVCGPGLPPVTVTENASEYKVSSAVTTKTQGVEVKATVIESCNLDGTTAATCTATVGGSAQGQSTTTSATVTYTDASSYYLQVQITGGNEKLANPTGKCQSGAASLNTRAVAFWGILGAVGAVGALAL